MNTIEKIGKIEVYALLITIISNNIIVNVPTVILNSTGTGSWINIIYLTIICLLFIFLITKLFEPFSNCDILDISEFLGGKTLKFVIALLFIILFILYSSLCLRYFSHSLQLLYFNDSPLVFLIVLFLVPVVIASKYGLKAISEVNLIFIPVALFFTVILFFTSIKTYVWERLFPILGYGVKETFLTQVTNLFAFNVVAFLYFIKPFLKKESDFKRISIFSVIVCGLYLMLTIMSLLMSFAFITQTDENFSLHLSTRLISFGNFLQRVDAIFVFTWILAIISFLSINVFFISHIIKKIFKLSTSSELVYPTSAILFTVALSYRNVAIVKFYSRNVYKIYCVVLVFVVSLIVLLLAYIKKKKQGVKT